MLDKTKHLGFSSQTGRERVQAREVGCAGLIGVEPSLVGFQVHGAENRNSGCEAAHVSESRISNVDAGTTPPGRRMREAGLSAKSAPR
jgi:hypothetical protein